MSVKLWYYQLKERQETTLGLDKINEFRKKQGLSIEELASISGIPKSTLAKIAAGITTNPNIDTVKAIARALHCSLDDFDDRVKELPVPTEPEANAKWQKIHSNFEKLNDAGQDRLAEYSDFLITKEEYQKERDPKPVETVRVWQAARSTDNSTPSGWVDMPKEEVEKIFNAPDADVDF